MFQTLEDRTDQIRWLRQRNQHISVTELVALMDAGCVEIIDQDSELPSGHEEEASYV